MVVRIRLQRFGQRNLPFYRIVVANSKSPRDGKFLERVGTYNPLPSKDGVKEITANSDRVKYWVSVGAQPSDRVAWLFGKIGLLPPPPPKSCDPERYKVPRKVYKMRQEEKYKKIAEEFPERMSARAAVKAKNEEKRKKKIEAEKALKLAKRGIN